MKKNTLALCFVFMNALLTSACTIPEDKCVDGTNCVTESKTVSETTTSSAQQQDEPQPTVPEVENKASSENKP